MMTTPNLHHKSRGADVFFPAWTWAQDPDPHNQGHGFTARPSTMMGPGVKFAYLSHVQRSQARTSCIRDRSGTYFTGLSNHVRLNSPPSRAVGRC
jgi:hypothetical protein